MSGLARTTIGVVSVAVVALLGFAGLSMTRAAAAPDLPDYGAAPSFTLLDQRGDTLRAADLRGSAWLASFVFTNCDDVCGLVTTRMARLRDSLRVEGLLGSGVRLLSITVDPARDTPEVLRAYAARYGDSPPSEWGFLTGSPPEEVRRVVQDGFHVTAMVPREVDHDHASGQTADYQVTHAPRAVLVDAEGRMRATYDVTEPDAVGRALSDLRLLVDG